MASDANDSIVLLEKLQALVKVGRQLTASMERAEPYLSNPPTTAAATRMRVRPLPASMEQVEQVLAVARHLAGRTSAPAGWNPNAPVIGFTTPNPLPHQLRGGVLGALQLERARQLERDRKRQRQQKAAREADAAKGTDTATNNVEQDGVENEAHDVAMADSTIDPKRRELSERRQQRFREPAPSTRDMEASQQQRPKITSSTMNLSDSSSEEDEDDDD